MLRFSELNITMVFILTILTMNFAFGNWFMQLAPLGVPINEMLCLLLAVRWFEKLLILGKKRFLITLILFWSFYSLIIMLPLGLVKHGIDAGRDATGQIDILILPIMATVVLLQNKGLKSSQFDRFLIFALVLEFCDRTILGPFFGSSDPTKLNASVFGGTIGSQIIVFLSLWYGIASISKNKIYIPILLILLSCSLILLLQNRFLYFGFFSGIMTLMFTWGGFVKKIPVYGCVIAVGFIFVQQLSGYLLQFVPDAGRLMKYASAGISVDAIGAHLATSFGADNEVFSGAGGGLLQRLGWWTSIMQSAINNANIMFLGQGFGVPLTSDYAAKVIREPHNSYMSVFARGGIIYFFIWFLIQALIIFKLRRAYFFFRGLCANSADFKFYRDISLAVHLLGVTVLITALVEPAFELPPYAMGYYALSGMIMGLYWKTSNAYTPR